MKIWLITTAITHNSPNKGNLFEHKFKLHRIFYLSKAHTVKYSH